MRKAQAREVAKMVAETAESIEELKPFSKRLKEMRGGSQPYDDPRIYSPFFIMGLPNQALAGPSGSAS